MVDQGRILALTGKASEAVHMLTSGIAALRSTGAAVSLPSHLSHLARAHAELGQFDGAWRCIGEAMTTVETTKERWFEAEVNRVAGEIALQSPRPMHESRIYSSVRFQSPANNKQNPGSCAPQ